MQIVCCPEERKNLIYTNIAKPD